MPIKKVNFGLVPNITYFVFFDEYYISSFGTVTFCVTRKNVSFLLSSFFSYFV